MSQLWLLPLGVGGAGAIAAAVVVRKLNRELEALGQAIRPLRAARNPGLASSHQTP